MAAENKIGTKVYLYSYLLTQTVLYVISLNIDGLFEFFTNAILLYCVLVCMATFNRFSLQKEFYLSLACPR